MSEPLPTALSLLSSPNFWNARKRSPRSGEESRGRAAGRPDAGERCSPPHRVTRWHALHDFLSRHAFYPLTLCTLLCFSFWFVRIILTRTLTYDFLIKNLFLAWVPYFLSLAIVHAQEHSAPQRLWRRIALWTAWLLMLPNAPYVFTDLIHWRNRPRVMPWWFDLGLVLMFGLAGCFAGVVSLRMMHENVRRALGTLAGWSFVTIVAFLCGFGIYLGRFERWNSWDVFTRPHRLLTSMLYRSFNPYLIDRTLGVTLMFGAMMLVTYVMFVSTRAGSPLTDRAPAR